MFDCVLPTRNGRTGTAFTSAGRVNIRNARHADEQSCLDEDCDCYTCRTFGRAYLRHLFVAGEGLGPRLLTLHNLRFYQRLMSGIRAALAAGRLTEWGRAFLNRYQAADSESPTSSESPRRPV
jgi:queuine tRNA-ribosyltransferase